MRRTRPSVLETLGPAAAGLTLLRSISVLEQGLPRTLALLKRRINDALSGPLPRGMRRRAWEIAIDWHLQPYYGEPEKKRNELYHSQPKQGTTTFHAYASACIGEYGRRYTPVLT